MAAQHRPPHDSSARKSSNVRPKRPKQRDKPPCRRPKIPRLLSSSPQSKIIPTVDFCRIIGISFSTLYRWEVLGIIPVGYLMSRDGCRWYSARFASLLVLFLRAKRGRGRNGLKAMSELIWDAWFEANIRVDTDGFSVGANDAKET